MYTCMYINYGYIYIHTYIFIVYLVCENTRRRIEKIKYENNKFK